MYQIKFVLFGTSFYFHLSCNGYLKDLDTRESLRILHLWQYVNNIIFFKFAEITTTEKVTKEMKGKHKKSFVGEERQKSGTLIVIHGSKYGKL